MLYLYLLTQKERTGYDTFDSCVVAAYSREDAVKIHPFLHKFRENCLPFDDYDKFDQWDNPEYIYKEQWKTRTWASCPENVECKFIGHAARDVMPNSIVCSSYNAG